MGIRHLIHTNPALLEKVAARIDAALGYPKPGVNIGPGPHAPAEQSVTLRHATIRRHPDGARAAYAIDDISRPRLAALRALIRNRIATGKATADELEIDTLGAEADVDETWDALP